MFAVNTFLRTFSTVSYMTILALPIFGSLAMAQTAPFRVALSGTPAPAGGNYSSFFNAEINAAGQVSFTANLSGGSSAGGLFAGTPGSLAAAALVGNPAPAGGNYSGSFTSVLNASGQVAFLSFLTGGSSPQGIFAGLPGSLTTVALRGSPAPAGGNYSAFGGTVSRNASGQIAFQASLSGGSSTQGIYAGNPGSLTAVALQGNPAPAGGNYNSFGNDASLNTSGKVAFQANLTGGSSSQGIFAGTPGSLTAVALQGNPAPIGGNYIAFNTSINYNAAGQVLFAASLTASSSGIFAGTPGSLAPVAMVGSPAPAGGNFGTFIAGLGLNSAGQVAFYSNLSGGSSTEGLFAGSPGSLAAIALQGNPAPNAGGDNYALFGSAPVLNGIGRVAFVANLTGAAATNRGLFAGTPGNIVLVVRKGDIIDVDPTAGVDNRTVNGITLMNTTGGEDGRPISFNDSGVIVYNLNFTDGSSGVFTSQIAVPEPATIALLGGSGVLILGVFGVRQYRRKPRGRWKRA